MGINFVIFDRREKLKGRKPTPTTTHPNKKSLHKQFSELLVQIVLPFSFTLNRRHAETVWADCLPKLLSVGFIGVGGFSGVGFFIFWKPQNQEKRHINISNFVW